MHQFSYTTMLPSQIIEPITHYASQIQTCITNKHLKLGKQLHSHLIKTALTLNIFLTNRLIDMYAKCNSPQSSKQVFMDHPFKNTHSWNTLISGLFETGLLNTAREMFDEMPERNRVSYNSMISGLSRNGCHRDAIVMFRRMQREYKCNAGGMLMDKFTVVSMATACASLGALNMLRQMHCVVIVLGLELNVIMYNALIDAYGKCRERDVSRKIFDGMFEWEKDVVSWTSMVNCCWWVGDVEGACWYFENMPVRNAVSWNALIAGMSQNGKEEEALDVFARMRDEGVELSSSTFVCVLSACAGLAVIDRGKQVHGYIVRCSGRSKLLNVFIFNALIDMYTKCGDMESAKVLFEVMPGKDIVSWNTLVTGFAQNGRGRESLGLFERMVELGFIPNHVTFLGVLSACSHMGLLYEGKRLFHLMEEYGLRPRSDHYAVLIDMYSRKHKAEEALKLIQSAPTGSDQIGMWGALLGACRSHGNLDLAVRAAEALFELEPGNSSRYIMLSNIYSAAGRWHDAREVRRMMNEKGLKKASGYSWVEVRNARHGFLAEDKSHAQKEEIYDVISKLTEQLGEAGYQTYKRDLIYQDGIEW